MKIPFYKYHGAGNDFVIIDQRKDTYITGQDQQLIERMCDRRFGIGGDGLMLVQSSEKVDFEMIYFNADGRTSSMCGNGGRCIVSLAARLGVFEEQCTFQAIDGLHAASLDRSGLVSLKMNNVSHIEQIDGDFILDTGSPHYVHFASDIDEVDMIREGEKIRYSDAYKAEGINVNYVEQAKCELQVRTYERGVEDETYACGTGVVAAAIASAEREVMSGRLNFQIRTKGGVLSVDMMSEDMVYSDIWLTGPATYVFEGVYDI